MASNDLLIDSRIVNGNNATVNTQFPWHVSIRSTNATGFIVTCGGALVSLGWVLTAAQCVQGFVTFQLGFGSINLKAPAVTRISTNYTIHPNYTSANLLNDIALIRTGDTALVQTTTIIPIRLPRLAEVNAPFLNLEGTVTGFGYTTNNGPLSAVLQYAPVRIINNTDCSSVYGPLYVSSSTICTLGYNFHAQAACDGDTGGPLSIIQDNINTLVGIVSFASSRGCTAGDPVGYTRTSIYASWISTIIGIAVRP